MTNPLLSFHFPPEAVSLSLTGRFSLSISTEDWILCPLFFSSFLPIVPPHNSYSNGLDEVSFSLSPRTLSPSFLLLPFSIDSTKKKKPPREFRRSSMDNNNNPDFTQSVHCPEYFLHPSASFSLVISISLQIPPLCFVYKQNWKRIPTFLVSSSSQYSVE